MCTLFFKNNGGNVPPPICIAPDNLMNSLEEIPPRPFDTNLLWSQTTQTLPPIPPSRLLFQFFFHPDFFSWFPEPLSLSTQISLVGNRYSNQCSPVELTNTKLDMLVFTHLDKPPPCRDNLQNIHVIWVTTCIQCVLIPVHRWPLCPEIGFHIL